MSIPAPTVNLYLKIASVTKYLVADQKARQSSINWGTPTTDTDRENLLDLAYTCINWAAPTKSTTAGFQNAVNYMFNLIGAFYNQANAIINGGSNANQLVGIYGQGNVLTPFPISLLVSSGQAGVQTITSSALLGVLDLTTLFIGNQVFQLGTGFSFNSITGTISFAPAGYTLQEGDSIIGLGFKPMPVTGGGSGSAPLSIIYVPATAGLITSVPILYGKTISLLLRGGLGTDGVITVGPIVGGEVLFDNAATTLTVAPGYEFIGGEILTIQYF